MLCCYNECQSRTASNVPPAPVAWCSPRIVNDIQSVRRITLQRVKRASDHTFESSRRQHIG